MNDPIDINFNVIPRHFTVHSLYELKQIFRNLITSLNLKFQSSLQILQIAGAPRSVKPEADQKNSLSLGDFRVKIAANSDDWLTAMFIVLQ